MTTFSGDNGQVDIETGPNGEMTVTVKPKTAPPPERVFRPRSKTTITDVNTEPTGRGIGLEGQDGIWMMIFCRDSCEVDVKVVRRGDDGNFVELYSFVLQGLTRERKRDLLKLLDDSLLTRFIGEQRRYPPRMSFKARLTAPGEIFVDLGGPSDDDARPPADLLAAFVARPSEPVRKRGRG